MDAGLMSMGISLQLLCCDLFGVKHTLYAMVCDKP